MPRKMRAPKGRLDLPENLLTETHRHWLAGEEFERDADDPLVWYALDDDNAISPSPPGARPWNDAGISGRDLWLAVGAPYAAEHVAQYPGTRHVHWWRFESTEPRRRLGGIGTPAHERLAHKLRFWCGVPIDWITEADIALYATDPHLRALDVPAIDPKFPPLYESEATYLDRLGLLPAVQRKRLGAEDFAPESVVDILALELE